MKSAIEIYVAMSRCREAQCCLLTKRFDKALFQSGPLSPENNVLLARLRGDDDAFHALLANYTARKQSAAATQQRAAAGRGRDDQAAKGAKNSFESQQRKGTKGGLANTKMKQVRKGRKGGLANDPITQSRKGQTPKKGCAPKRRRADHQVWAGVSLQPRGGLHVVCHACSLAGS